MQQLKQREHNKLVHNWRELDDSVTKYDRAAYLKLRNYVPALLPIGEVLWRWEGTSRLAFLSEELFGHIENYGTDLRYAFLSVPFRWPEARGEPDGVFAAAVKQNA